MVRASSWTGNINTSTRQIQAAYDQLKAENADQKLRFEQQLEAQVDQAAHAAADARDLASSEAAGARAQAESVAADMKAHHAAELSRAEQKTGSIKVPIRMTSCMG